MTQLRHKLVAVVLISSVLCWSVVGLAGFAGVAIAQSGDASANPIEVTNLDGSPDGSDQNIRRGRTTEVRVEFEVTNLQNDGMQDTLSVKFPESFSLESNPGINIFYNGGRQTVTAENVAITGPSSNVLQFDIDNPGDAGDTYEITTFVDVTGSEIGDGYPINLDIASTGNGNANDVDIGSINVIDNNPPQNPTSTTIDTNGQQADGIVNAAEADSVDVTVGFSGGETSVDGQDNPESGTVTVELTDRNDNTVTGTAPADTDSTTTTVTLSNVDDTLVDGPITARANIEDDASNVNNESFTAESSAVTLDTVGPTISGITVENGDGSDPSGYIRGDDSVRIAATVTDTNGVDGSTVEVDASALGASNTLSLSDGDGDDVYDATVPAGDITLPADGTVSGFTVSADDSPGNANSASGGSITVDTTQPAISGVTVTQQGGDGDDLVAPGDTVSVEADVTDAGAGVDTVTADASALGGTGSETLTLDTGSTYSTTVTVGTSPTEGAVSPTVTATDRLGTQNTDSSDSVDVDATAPTVTDVTLDGSGGDVTLSVTTDEQLGSDAEDNLEVRITDPAGDDWQTYTLSDFDETSGSGSYTYALSATQAYDQGDGQYEVTVLNARDTAGNNGGTNGDPTDVGDTYVRNENAPTIEGSTLDSDNSYIDVTFSEGVSADSSTDPTSISGLTADDFELTYTDNGGSASGVVVDGVTRPDGETVAAGTPLSGGEQVVRVHLTVQDAPASGVETISLSPASASAIYDRVGSPVSDGESTAETELFDRDRPSVTSASISNAPIDDGDAGVTQVVTVTFDEEMDTTSSIDVDITGLRNGPYTIENGQWSNGDTTFTGEVSIPDDEEDTTATIAVSSVTDTSSAGNFIDPNPDTSNTFAVDTVSPTIDESGVDAVQSGTVDLTSQFDIGNSDGGTTTYEYSTDGGTTYQPIGSPAAWDTSALTDGPVTLRLTDTDDAGNSVTATVGVTVDNNAPTLPGDYSVTATAVEAGAIEVSFDDVTDAGSGSGVETYRILRSTSAGSGYSEIDTVSDDGSATFTYTDAAGDGSPTTDAQSYYYVVEAVDGADKTVSSTQGATTATADATAPTVDAASITLTQQGGDDTVNDGDTVSVSADVTDATSGVGTVTVDVSRLGGPADLVLTQAGGDTYDATFAVGGDGPITADDGSLSSFTVSADDEAGNANSGDGGSVTLDTTAPAVTSVTVRQDGGDDIVSSGDTVLVEVTATDATSGVGSVTVDGTALDSDSNPATLSSAGGNEYTTTFVVDDAPAAADGEVTLSVSADDGQGNENTGNTDTVTLDTNPPDSPTGVTAEATSGGNVELAWTDVDESGSGVTGYVIERATASGGPYSAVTTVSDGDATSYTDSPPTSNGQTYYYTVSAEDAAGRVSAASAEVSATTDNVDPSVGDATIETPIISDDDTGTAQTITVNFDEAMDTTVDPTVSVTGLTGSYTGSGGQWTDGDTYETSVTIDDDEEEATATIQVGSARDDSGNTMSTETPGTFTVDTKNPTVTNDFGGGEILSETVDLTGRFTVTDDDGGTTTYAYSADGGASYVPIDSPGSWDTTAVADGSVTVRATDTDDAGNDDSSSATVTVDNDAPVLPGDYSVTATAIQDGDIEVVFDDVNEAAGSGVTEYRVLRRPSGGSYSQVGTVTDDDSGSYTFTDTRGGGDGTVDGTTYDYAIEAVDDNDQVSAASASVTATADATAPGSLSVSASNPSERTIEIELTADEALDTVDVPIVGPDGDSLDRADFTESVEAGTYTYTATYTPTADGSYSTNLDSAVDAAGNDGAASESDTVTVDTTGPSITAIAVTQQGGDGTVTPGDTVSVSADVTDSLNGIDADTVTVDASALGGPAALSLTPAGGDTYAATFTVDSPTADDGSVALSVSASDTDANANTETGDVTLDTTGPTVSGVTVTQLAGDDTVTPGDTVVVNATVTDATSSVDASAVEVNVSDLNSGAGTIGLTDGTGNDVYDATFTVTSPTADDGPVTLTVEAADDQGLNDSASDTVTLDTTAPSVTNVTVTQAGGDETVGIGDTVNVSADVTDATSSVDASTVAVDASALGGSNSLSLTLASGTTYDATFTVARPVTADGVVSLTVEAADDQGLANSSSDTVELDTVAPQNPTSTTVTNGPISDSATVDVALPAPPEDGTVTVELSDGSTSVTTTAELNTSRRNQTVTVQTASLAQGTINVRARLVDDGGNENPGGYTATSTVIKRTQAGSGGGGGGGGGGGSDDDDDAAPAPTQPTTPEEGTRVEVLDFDDSTDGDTDIDDRNVDIDNVRANENVDIDLAAGDNDTGGVIRANGLNVTFRSDRDYSMQVQSRPSELTVNGSVVERDGMVLTTELSADGRSFTGDTGLMPNGFIEITHAFSNEEADNVSVAFQVSTDRVNASDTDPENVSLYRDEPDGWRELPTELQGQRDGAYRYTASSPGLSLFAVGTPGPVFDVVNTTVTDADASDGTIAATVSVRNVGSTAGNYTAVLSARPRTGNGSLLDSAEGALTPGETRTFSLSATLNASQVGTIVLANQTLTTVAPSDLPESGSGDDSSSATGGDGASGDGRGDGSSTAGDTGSDDSSSAVDGANTSSVTSQTGSDLPGGNSYWVLLVILLALFIGTLALQEYADGN